VTDPEAVTREQNRNQRHVNALKAEWAADRAALVAERDTAVKREEWNANVVHKVEAELAQAVAERDRYRDALREVAGYTAHGPRSWGACEKVALAALGRHLHP
jgi:uncharacterized membrane protein YccC